MEQRHALQLRPSGETRFADELAALKAADQGSMATMRWSNVPWSR
jgi:hypothetical protein